MHMNMKYKVSAQNKNVREQCQFQGLFKYFCPEAFHALLGLPMPLIVEYNIEKVGNEQIRLNYTERCWRYVLKKKNNPSLRTLLRGHP